MEFCEKSEKKPWNFVKHRIFAEKPNVTKVSDLRI
jgi:hypothetical protein